MRFKIDRASRIVGSKFIVFALLYFVFEGKFSEYKPPGAYIRRGGLTEGFLSYWFGGLYLEGLIHGGAYLRNFTVSLQILSITAGYIRVKHFVQFGLANILIL